MKPQGCKARKASDAAMSQISFGERAGDRSRLAEQPSCGTRSIRRAHLYGGLWELSGTTKEAPGFGKGLLEARQLAGATNEIEQIAMLAGCSITPFARATAGEMHIEALSRRVGDITHVPIAAAAMPVRKVMPTDGFGVVRQASGELGGTFAG
jgi:hypothetical protein